MEKVSGIYPGCLGNPDEIDELEEYMLYLIIDSTVTSMNKFKGTIDYMQKHNENKKIINEAKQELEEEKYALDYLVYKTKKFGVDIPEPKKGESIEITDSFRQWLKFYSDHFRNNLSDEEWNDFMKALSTGKDVTKYLPEGRWNDTKKSKK